MCWVMTIRNIFVWHKKKTQKNEIPFQAVFDKLEIFDVPQELKTLNKLEIALASQRLLFKKITIMSKGQMPKIRGAVCNIAVDVRDICNSLPRNSQSSGIVLVKLFKKLPFSGHVYFESVCLQKVLAALFYLKNNK